jgi:hypothetical protein
VGRDQMLLELICEVRAAARSGPAERGGGGSRPLRRRGCEGLLHGVR